MSSRWDLQVLDRVFVSVLRGEVVPGHLFESKFEMHMNSAGPRCDSFVSCDRSLFRNTVRPFSRKLVMDNVGFFGNTSAPGAGSLGGTYGVRRRVVNCRGTRFHSLPSRGFMVDEPSNVLVPNYSQEEVDSSVTIFGVLGHVDRKDKILRFGWAWSIFELTCMHGRMLLPENSPCASNHPQG